MVGIEPGSQIDGYIVEELIVHTGTASILRARDQRDGTPIALKVPHMEVAGDPLFYQRFVREQEICESLDHASVVRVFPKKSPRQKYIAMELAPGQMLRSLMIASGTLPVERAVKIGAGVCEALQYVHARGVVHRDLKPENIMIDDQDRIKLIDFGIASREGARRLTFGKLSQVMGSPDYIAPEQVQGKRGDARTDIYATGVILYEMMTGRAPFAGDNPFVAMHQRLVSDPPPARELNSDIPAALDKVVRRAMARIPEDRYESAQALARNLLHPERASREAASPAGSRKTGLYQAWLRLADLWR